MNRAPLDIGLVAGLGLALGSFLNVVVWRLPQGRRAFFASARSHCPACRKMIAWYDNVPLLGFLLLRGRCRHCGRAISRQYPLLEALMALLTVLLYDRFGLTVYFYKYLTFVFLMLGAAAIDRQTKTIPDGLLLAGMAAGLYFSFVCPFPGWRQGLLSLAVGLGLPLLVVSCYELLRGKTMMGGGDIKLMGLISLFLGWQRPGAMIVYSSLSALVWLMIMRGFGKRGPMPFAPFLAFGAGLVLWAPRPPGFFHYF